MMDLKPELKFAGLAVINVLSRAVALPWVLKVISILAIERDQSYSL
jgi:hypothetical protein